MEKNIFGFLIKCKYCKKKIRSMTMNGNNSCRDCKARIRKEYYDERRKLKQIKRFSTK